MTSTKLQKLTKIAAEKQVTLMSFKLLDIRCLSWNRVTKKGRTTERKILDYNSDDEHDECFDVNVADQFEEAHPDGIDTQGY